MMHWHKIGELEGRKHGGYYMKMCVQAPVLKFTVFITFQSLRVIEES